MPFMYTESMNVFDTDSILPGTAVHIQTGAATAGTFVEGNGIVTASAPLSLSIRLYELQTQAFVDFTVPLASFLDGTIQMKVLTVEDGTGEEPTGAVPTDLEPPGNVTDLSATATSTTANLTYTMPLDADFSHVVILRDGFLVADNVTATSYEVTGLQPQNIYNFTVISVDTSANRSEGTVVSVTTPA